MNDGLFFLLSFYAGAATVLAVWALHSFAHRYAERETAKRREAQDAQQD